jgi:hypothetical protein
MLVLRVKNKFLEKKNKKVFKRFKAQKTLAFICPFSQSEKTRLKIRFFSRDVKKNKFKINLNKLK